MHVPDCQVPAEYLAVVAGFSNGLCRVPESDKITDAYNTADVLGDSHTVGAFFIQRNSSFFS